MGQIHPLDQRKGARNLNQDTKTIRVERGYAAMRAAARRHHEQRVATIAFTIFALGTAFGWWLKPVVVPQVARAQVIIQENSAAAVESSTLASLQLGYKPPAIDDAVGDSTTNGVSDSASMPTGISESTIPWMPETVTRWLPEITGAATAHGIDPELVAIVMLVESGGGDDATSRSGATSLMQVMPATGAGIAAERGIEKYDLYDPATSIDFGAHYLAQQMAAFGKVDDPDWQASVELAAAAYNGGPGSVIRGRLSSETIRYRRWMGGFWRERHDSASPTFEEWKVAGGSRLIQNAEEH